MPSFQDWLNQRVTPDGGGATAPITRGFSTNNFGGQTSPITQAYSTQRVYRPGEQATFGFQNNLPPGTQTSLPFQGSIESAGPSPGRQLSFDFGGAWNQNSSRAFAFSKKWGRMPTRIRNRIIRNASQVGPKMFSREAMRGYRTGLIFDAVFAGADIVGSSFRYAGMWAAQTGRQEGLVGGAAYGATRAVGANVAASAAGTAGYIAGGALGTLLFPGVGTVVGGLIGGAIGGITGYTAGGDFIDEFAQDVGRLGMGLAATGISQNKLNFGGDFRDSQGAYTMRQLAVQEMAGSLLNARQVLGNEANFFHR